MTTQTISDRWLCWQSEANPSLPAKVGNAGRFRQKAARAATDPRRKSQHLNALDVPLPNVASRANLVCGREPPSRHSRFTGRYQCNTRSQAPAGKRGTNVYELVSWSLLMLATTCATSVSSSGGRQRIRFQANRTSRATSGSTPCQSRCPVKDAIVELRSPSATPSCTNLRHCGSERPTRGPRTGTSIHRGRGASVISSGERPAAHS